MESRSATGTRQGSPSRVDGYAPLRDYAAIGDGRTTALVALDGAVDWFTLPRMDGPTTFAAVLDSRAGGRWTLGPVHPFTAERRYLPGTNVLETTFRTGDGAVRVTDAMSRPWDARLAWPEIVRRVEGVSGSVELAWSVEPRPGYATEHPSVERGAGALLLCSSKHVLALQAFDAGEPQAGAGSVSGRFTARDGTVAVLALSAFDGPVVTPPSRDELLHRLDSTAEHWRGRAARCHYDGPWREAVLRSALALELLADRDTGAIAAAATMGLPESIGGERNFDYRYTWLRDGNLTLDAMLQLGYDDRVHDSLTWMLSATERTHPWLRPIYRLDGRPRVPQSELDLAGYRGSRPVTVGNSAESQLQLGNYGDVLNMAFRHVDDGNALTSAAGVRLGELADFVCGVWDHDDSGLWELGQRRPYTQSKLACWLALHRATQLHERGAIRSGDAGRWRAVAREIRGYVERHCWSERLHAYTRAAGSEELDAAVLLATRGAFVEEQPERLSGTVDAIRRELGAGGPLVYRYSGMRDAENAFLACSFWVVDALARVGRVDEAVETMDALAALANDVGLYPEQIDPADGGFRGNIPQALTHLSVVLAARACVQAGAS